MERTANSFYRQQLAAQSGPHPRNSWSISDVDSGPKTSNPTVNSNSNSTSSASFFPSPSPESSLSKTSPATPAPSSSSSAERRTPRRRLHFSGAMRWRSWLNSTISRLPGFSSKPRVTSGKLGGHQTDSAVPVPRRGGRREWVRALVRCQCYAAIAFLPGILLGLLLRASGFGTSSHIVNQESPVGTKTKLVMPHGTGPTLILKGSPAERIQQLCAAQAFMSRVPSPFTAVWEPDADAAFAAFAELYILPETSPGVTVTATKPSKSQGSFLVKVQTGRNSSASDAGQGTPAAPPWATGNTVHFQVVADPSVQSLEFVLETAEAVSQWKEVSQSSRFLRNSNAEWLDTSAAAAAAECARSLAPAASVKLHLGNKQLLRRALRSQAVFLEERREGERCMGCGDTYPLVLCTARHMTLEYLKNPDSDFVVGGGDPSKAEFVASIFDESRAPLLPATVPARLQLKCQSLRDLLEGSNAGPTDTSKMSERMEAEFKAAEALRSNRSRVEELMKQCLVLQTAELFLLGLASSLIHTIPSASAFFIASRTAMHKNIAISSFVETFSHDELESLIAYLPPAPPAWRGFPQQCVCLLPYVEELGAYPYAENVIIDEELRIVYCSVEKVGSTSIKMFLRSLKGLPHLDDYYWTHDTKRNGLTPLFPTFKGGRETEGIRHMTRRDFVKILFVRNPFPRILSSYMDKHVKGDPKDSTKTSISGRAKYSYKMFGQDFADLFAFHNVSYVPWGQPITFHTFVKLSSKAVAQRPRPDQHIATQTSLCRVDAIKYDFVGYLETFDDDVDSLVKILEQHLKGRKNVSAHKSVFNLGRKVHRTESDKRMRLMYTEEAARIVRELYRADMDVPLNNIKFEVPQFLQKFCGT